MEGLKHFTHQYLEGYWPGEKTLRISAQLSKYKIPEIDLVIVDLYPFEETVKSADDEDEIIEKIDIGGISLIRAAAKNYNDVIIVSGREQYPDFLTSFK